MTKIWTIFSADQHTLPSKIPDYVIDWQRSKWWRAHFKNPSILASEQRIQHVPRTQRHRKLFCIFLCFMSRQEKKTPEWKINAFGVSSKSQLKRLGQLKAAQASLNSEARRKVGKTLREEISVDQSGNAFRMRGKMQPTKQGKQKGGDGKMLTSRHVGETNNRNWQLHPASWGR